MKYIVTLLFIFTTMLCAWAQGPGQRIALINLQQAKIVESSRAGQIPLTNTDGNQRYAQYTEIDLVPISYTPSVTGNTSNFSEFVSTITGDIWYIDWQGRGIKISSSGGSSADYDWLTIADNSIPDSILDSIYTKNYAAVGMRRVYPNATLLVGDSTQVSGANGVVVGDRSARWGFVRMTDDSWSSIGQEGNSLSARLGGGTTAFKVQSAGGTGPTAAATPFRDIASIRTDSLIRFNDYPASRRDTQAVQNVLYTDSQGYLRSGELLSGGGAGLNYFDTSGGNLLIGDSADTLSVQNIEIAPVQSIAGGEGISIATYPGGNNVISLSPGIQISKTLPTGITDNIALYGFAPAYSNSSGSFFAANTGSASTLHNFYLIAGGAGSATVKGAGEVILTATFAYTVGSVYYVADSGGLATTADEDFDSAAVYIIASLSGNRYLVNLLSPKHFAQ